MTCRLLYLYQCFGGVCFRYLHDIPSEEEKMESNIFFNFLEDCGSRVLRNAVTFIKLYKDSYSVGWNGNQTLSGTFMEEWTCTA